MVLIAPQFYGLRDRLSTGGSDRRFAILRGEMSQENVEIVRQVYEAAPRRDRTALLSLYDPEVKWDTTRPGTPGDIAGNAVYHGHDGLREWFLSWYEAWDDLIDDYLELIDAGEQVISVSTMRGRGRSSGAEVTSSGYAGVWTIRDGRIVRVVWFATRAEALDAAGLSEERHTAPEPRVVSPHPTQGTT